ncbi:MULTISPECIES: TetR family transcriptional regulator [Frankia]|uniref:Regulatory protein n=1 Tax=Frankia alni (strain DSM 45986 / CECT 9034 / ACN14a) TaxID=326424 RepID=Q0RTM1_FRAAA|nr:MULTISPECIES: TetR family transcriptional regulator [Frankia]CAJ59077.1 putative regulatory protein [Frankia alni ACN14a]
MPRQTLSRQTVLDAALRLADEGGLPGLTMRRLAAELGVEAMSLYNHVANKRDLLDGIAARVYESIALPDPALAWDERLRLLGNGTFAAFAAHPVVARAVVAGQADPRSVRALRVFDAFFGALLDAGLDEPTAVRRYRSLAGQLFGAVLVQTASPAGAQADQADLLDDWSRTAARSEQLPHLRVILPVMAADECRPDFGPELDLFIDGLRPARRAPPTPAR